MNKRTISSVMRELGKRSGKARMVKLTPEQRSAIAKKAAKARWAAKKGKA